MFNARLLSLVAVAGALTLLWIDSARAQPPGSACAETRPQVIECGSGKGALRVIEGTSSRSGAFALAWRAPETGPNETPDVEAVENHLVRLRDGKPLALVVGRHWSTDTQRANHVHVHTAWSPNERWLLVADAGKWALEAIAAYPVDASVDRIQAAGLFRLVTSAATRELISRKGKVVASRYVLDLDGSKPLSISNDGIAAIPVVFQIPKQDGEIAFLVKVRLTRGGAGVHARAAVMSVEAGAR